MKFKLLSIAALGLCVACTSCKKENDGAMKQELTQVKVTTVKSEKIGQIETYTATVESDVKNNISPNAPMRIRQIFVEVGDYVSKGQIVALLDQATENQLAMSIQSQQSAIAGQEANYQALVANVHSYEAQVQQTKREADRMDALYKAGGISKSDNEAVQLQLQTQQRALEAQREQLKAQRAAIAAQQAQLKGLNTQSASVAENNKLRSPISGYVTARNYDAGDMTGGLPVLTIEQTNPVKLLLNVSEVYYHKVKKGTPVEIKLDAYEERGFGGNVTIVYPTVDQVTHTFPVEVTINNSDQVVRPGMFARATITFEYKDHVVIPDEALVKQMGAGDRFVYVYDPSSQTVRYQKVELGRHMGDKYEIKSGVKPNEKVVVAGQSRLNNGKKVQVVK
ncbi:MAG: efflux RND transporter periplasmic adaptor subunit [Bacteroidaceae bacterium]|nr:efflux RND transporter periplasmic adaptor subunit [Bacteroidaceae bacterium]